MDLNTQPPPHFWDNLSKLYLTRSALIEHNRRNPKIIPTLEISRHLQPSVTEEQADLQKFARCGGPDLSELRGVNKYNLIKISANDIVSFVP